MKTHTHIATVASQTEGVAAVSCMESHMDRRPLGSIDPNSIRETELHTECRRRRDRESLYSPQHDRERDAARQRAAASRRKETDEARKGGKVAGEPTKNSYEAPAGDNTSERGEVTACCCGSAGRKGSRQSEANERGCCQAQRTR